VTFTLAELLHTEDVDGALERFGVDPTGATLEVVGYPSGSPATAALYRLRGGDGSLFCKVLQHVRHWPGVAQMPPHIAADFVEQLPWRAELDLWEPWVVTTLPEGLRPPTLHALVEMPDDRAAVWMEDVAECADAWTLERYERAAYLLGRWNARSTDPEMLERCPHTRRNYGLRMYAENAVASRGLMPLADDNLWAHPWLAEHADLRAGLRELASEIPEMLDRMDTFVQCVPHGDASPQNLLVPADDPESFVVIDISFHTPHALGFDLGQLLVGLVHAGQMPASRMPAIAAAIVPAYLRALHEEGIGDRDAEVRDAFATGVLLRSGFDGFLLELLEDPTDAHRHAFDERVEMARVLVELYRSP
jgi:hypothetical protein